MNESLSICDEGERRSWFLGFMEKICAEAWSVPVAFKKSRFAFRASVHGAVIYKNEGIRELLTVSKSEILKVQAVVDELRGITAKIMVNVHSSAEKLDEGAGRSGKYREKIEDLNEYIARAAMASREISSAVAEINGFTTGTNEGMRKVDGSSSRIAATAQSLLFGSQLRAAMVDALYEEHERVNLVYGAFEGYVKTVVAG